MTAAAPSLSFSNTSSMASSYGTTMRQYSEKDRHLSVNGPTDVGTRVVSFLRRRHPQKTADHVQAETGIAASTVAKWIERASIPNGIAMIRLTAAYGPEFLADVMHSPPDWLVKARREEKQAVLDRKMALLRAEMEGL